MIFVVKYCKFPFPLGNYCLKQLLNAFHAAGECRQCRRHVKRLTTFVKYVEIVEFHDHIWNHHEKCIQISINMPGIGSLIREIHVKITDN